TSSDLNESSKALSVAAKAVDRTQAQLTSARIRLAQTQSELAIARSEDLRLAAQLRQAKAELATASARVVVGQQNLAAEEAIAGDVIRDQYQQQSNLLPIAVLVDTNSPADLQTRLQWSTTMFDSTQAEIDRLTIIQRQLDAAKAHKAELAAQVRADRKAAAAALRTKQTLEARAAAEEASVQSLLSQQRAIEEAAADDVAEDKAHYAQLTNERASVEKRIASRIAEAKVAAARKAAAEKAAKVAARKAAAAERPRKAQEQARERAHRGSAKTRQKATSKNGKSSTSKKKAAHKSSHQTSMASASHGFSYPVSAPITSAFGMRFHPVLRYWKLHDGTDFGAGCGTPIRAPYSGQVAERYYNAGYGNRLMIDHGFRSGKYVTTGYNHASRYVVHVGQHVRQGQVIGYVGNTGFSTGCHLHLMVWLNGRVTNPMTWF
ncbi:MAG TPA: peptidoglycan DD-metalloendopeptidase family protein, partial [Propionibacteriaceae bacterium]|nr:peptidoglycan DD-metalloendopeptidase family protein [Propionibacteriaceae bacterium]